MYRIQITEMDENDEIKREALTQELETIDMQAIFAALNPKPKRVRRPRSAAQ